MSDNTATDEQREARSWPSAALGDLRNSLLGAAPSDWTDSRLEMGRVESAVAAGCLIERSTTSFRTTSRSRFPTSSPQHPAPTTPEERSFVATPTWKGAVVRGRIERAEGNGFVMWTDTGEQSFSPARIGAGGKAEADEGRKDVVDGLLNDLAYCRPSQSGLYQCVALHKSRETPIPEIPVSAKRGQPA